MSCRLNWVEVSANYSIRRQCRLAGLSRSNFYYNPVPESKENLHLMRLIDARYMKHPEYGYPRMTDWLIDEGHDVNPKRIARLMQTMGLQAITPGPHTSKPCPGHKIYPYLLRNVDIMRPNHVWSIDITYIPMASGFLYLVAIIDWYSRYVISWELSNSMDSLFCVSALERALESGTPEIFNTDQGVQFTSNTTTTSESILRWTKRHRLRYSFSTARGQRLTPSDAVASLRPRPSGPPLRGRAPQSDGIKNRRLFAA